MSSQPPTIRVAGAAIAALVALLSGTVSAQDAPKPPESTPNAPSPQQDDASSRPRDRTTQAGGRRGGDRGGRGSGRGPRATVDLATAQKTLLESESPADRDFMQLVQAATQESTNRKLPSLYENAENTYGPEQLALRAEVYGPLLEKPRTREYLRSLARKPAGSGWDYTGSTAALILADAPDEQDFDALFDGYQGTAPEQRANIARQLGRAIVAMPGNPKAELALARLRTDAAEGKPAQRGAAIEGLFRAGHAREAAEVLEPLLAGQQDPLDAVTLLQACSRLFQRSELDPFMKARAIATAETAIEMLLDSDEDVTPMQVISGKGRTLRAAIAFLQDVGGGAEIPLFLRCLDSERAQRLLGMDGLQNLRFALQSRRSKATPEQGAKLDERWLSILVDAGNRLFALEEEPMEPEEKAAFWDARDLRYNALSYFCDQFRRTQDAGPSVKERLGKELDLPALLATFVQAKEDVLEEGAEDGTGARYTAVADKVENRVLALQLLALIEREWNRDPGGLDVFAEAYAILSTEIHAPILSVEQVVAFRMAREPGRMLSIPVGLAPDDAFVQNAAAQAIANLGYVVHTGPHLIQIEVDTEYPWPWPTESTSTTNGSQAGGRR